MLYEEYNYNRYSCTRDILEHLKTYRILNEDITVMVVLLYKAYKEPELRVDLLHIKDNKIILFDFITREEASKPHLDSYISKSITEYLTRYFNKKELDKRIDKF